MATSVPARSAEFSTQPFRKEEIHETKLPIIRCDIAGSTLFEGAQKVYTAFRTSSLYSSSERGVTFATHTAADASENSFYQFPIQNPPQKKFLSFYLTEPGLQKLLTKRHDQLEIVLLPPLSCELEGLAIVIGWMQDAVHTSFSRRNGIPFPTKNILKACYIERALRALGLSVDADDFRQKIMLHYFVNKDLNASEVSKLWNSLPYDSFWVKHMRFAVVRQIKSQHYGTVVSEFPELVKFIQISRSFEAYLEICVGRRLSPQYRRDPTIERWVMNAADDEIADEKNIEYRTVKAEAKMVPYMFEWVDFHGTEGGFFVEAGVKWKDRELFPRVHRRRIQYETPVGREWHESRRQDEEDDDDDD